MDIDTNGLIDLDRLERAPHYCVYVLIDPRLDGNEIERIRYVGRTFDLYKRVENHMNHPRHGVIKTTKDAWIRELLDAGLEPQLRVVCRCGTLQENKFMEQFFIKYFGRIPQINLTNGYSLNEKTPGIDEFIEPGVAMWEAYEKALHWFYHHQITMIEDLYAYLKKLNMPNENN